MVKTKNEHLKFLIYSTVFLVIIFLILMGQNVIRYGAQDSYDPWRSLTYLAVSVLLFVPLLPLVFQSGKKISSRSNREYWALSISIGVIVLLAFFITSNSVLYLLGYYEQAIDGLYAQRYLGREALFHFLLLLGDFYYIRINSQKQPRLISGTLGRREITISAELIKWIESDDHYLKIHTLDSSLLKRTTLERMSEELRPHFIRIHRKYLVNRQQIVGKEKKQRDEYVILKSGERLKIGRSYQPLSI